MENPRDNDNLSTMVCFHRKYKLGDTHDYVHSDYESWEEMREAIECDHDVAAILPMYMIDHSGLSIRTTPFGCPWDSGQIGFVFIEKQKMIDEFKDRVSIPAALEELALSVLVAEVHEYDKYIQGDEDD